MSNLLPRSRQHRKLFLMYTWEHFAISWCNSSFRQRHSYIQWCMIRISVISNVLPFVPVPSHLLTWSERCKHEVPDRLLEQFTTYVLTSILSPGVTMLIMDFSKKLRQIPCAFLPRMHCHGCTSFKTFSHVTLKRPLVLERYFTILLEY